MPKSSSPSFQDNDALLTYRVGPVFCCGPTMPVVTITPPPDLTHLPGTNIAEPGIFKHGSYVVSATDLRYRFGVKQENWKNPGQVIVAQHNDLTRGYFVDEIIDVIHLPSTGWGQLPAQLPRGVFSRTLLLNNKIYLYAEFDKLSQLQGSGYLSDYISQLEKHDQTQPLLNEITSTSSTEHKSRPVSIKKKTAETKNICTPTISKENTEESIPNEVKESNVNNITNVNELKYIVNKSDASINKQAEGNKTHDTLSKNNDMKNSSLKNSNTKSSNIENSSIDNSDIESIDTKRNDIKSSEIKNSKIKNTEPAATNRTVQKQAPSKIVDKNIPNASIIRSKGKSAVTNTDKKSKDSEKHLSKSESIIKSQYKSTNNLNSKPTNRDNNSHANSSKPLEKEDESSRNYMGWFIMIFFFILSILGGVYFLTEQPKVMLKENVSNEINYNEESSNEGKDLYSSIHNNSYSDETRTISKPNYSNDTLPLSTSEIDIATKQKNTDSHSKSSSDFNTKLNTQYSSEASSKPNIQSNSTASTDTESNTNTIKNNTQYHASIKESNNTITIELDGPLPPQFIKSESPKDESDIKINDMVAHVNEPTQTSIDKTVPQSELSIDIDTSNINENKSDIKTTLSTSMEIVHIIVKGDTLWAIAKRYLLNPFRYPELAKLSKIKNPDLIYPGNRVRIIYKNSPK